jgi:predicted anti-sigma-YlaC factor YlaD
MADGTEITCQELVEVVTDYLEGKLSPEEAAVFEAHLELCDGCRTYLDQMRVTIAAVGRIEESDVPPGMRDTLLAAYRGRTRS